MQGNKKTRGKATPGGKNKFKQTHKQKRIAKINNLGRVIAPKKAKQVQITKLKKSLEKAIGKNIEQQIASRASAQEPRSLTLVANPNPKQSKKKNKKQ